MEVTKNELREIWTIVDRVLGPAVVSANKRALAWAEALRTKVDSPRLAEPIILYGEYSAVWAVPPEEESQYPGHAWFCGLCGASDEGADWKATRVQDELAVHLDDRHPDVRFRVVELDYYDGEISAPNVYEYTGEQDVMGMGEKVDDDDVWIVQHGGGEYFTIYTVTDEGDYPRERRVGEQEARDALALYRYRKPNRIHRVRKVTVQVEDLDW